MANALIELPTFDPKSGDLLSVVETPKDSPNKYAFNFELGVFELRRVLPRGMQFPYDFGFVPHTEAEDGDPLDILLVLEDTAPQGCVIRVRVIGVLEARQREPKGEWVRNDRLIAVAVHAKVHANLKSVKELNPLMLDELEAFFRDYNTLDGKEFDAVRRGGPSTAEALIEKARGKGRTPSRSGLRSELPTT